MVAVPVRYGVDPAECLRADVESPVVTECHLPRFIDAVHVELDLEAVRESHRVETLVWRRPCAPGEEQDGTQQGKRRPRGHESVGDPPPPRLPSSPLACAGRCLEPAEQKRPVHKQERAEP